MTSGPNHVPFISTSRMKPNAMPAVMRDLRRTRITDPVYLDRQGLRVKMCVWLGVSRGLDLAFLNAD